jgi:tetratricopeptide (TPR) repeat protein
MYARKRERELKKYRPAPTRPKSKGTVPEAVVDHTKYVLRALEDIDIVMNSGEAESSLHKAQRLMRTVLELTDSDLPSKQEFIASLHSCMGNAYLEMGKPEKALEHHLNDFKITEEIDEDGAWSRALDNVGRSYCVLGEFQRAVDYWQRKVPLLKTPEESTWLYHELGRCHLELGDFPAARDLGEKSLVAAREAQDNMWQLNASVLIAQTESKLGELPAALQSFQRSLELAELLEDGDSQTAIKKALEEINSRIVEEMKPDGDTPSD